MDKENTLFITANPVTIRLDMAMVAYIYWKYYHMDVKSAYLDGYLGGGVCVSGFSYKDSKMHIKSIYCVGLQMIFRSQIKSQWPSTLKLINISEALGSEDVLMV